MTRYRNLGEIVEQIEWLRYLNDIPRDKRVHLSTIHRAKGLEHRAVILLGCVEGVLPFQVKDQANIPEERRLAYVALTRAKDLFIAIITKDAVRGANRTLPVYPRNGAPRMRVGKRDSLKINLGLIPNGTTFNVSAKTNPAYAPHPTGNY